MGDRSQELLSIQRFKSFHRHMVLGSRLTQIACVWKHASLLPVLYSFSGPRRLSLSFLFYYSGSVVAFPFLGPRTLSLGSQSGITDQNPCKTSSQLRCLLPWWSNWRPNPQNCGWTRTAVGFYKVSHSLPFPSANFILFWGPVFLYDFKGSSPRFAGEELGPACPDLPGQEVHVRSQRCRTLFGRLVRLAVIWPHRSLQMVPDVFSKRQPDGSNEPAASGLVKGIPSL